MDKQQALDRIARSGARLVENRGFDHWREPGWYVTWNNGGSVEPVTVETAQELITEGVVKHAFGGPFGTVYKEAAGDGYERQV